MAHFDDHGLFWAAETRQTRNGPRESSIDVLKRRLTGMSFDQTYVTPPLVAAPSGVVALDLETEDPDIQKRGPSWAFAGRGKILGFAVAWEGFEAYYAINHCSGNVDSGPVLDWVTDLLKREDVIIAAANASYDIGWCRKELGLYPRGGVVDVQFMAALLDEYRLSYSLESISQSVLKVGKNTGALNDIEKNLGVKHSDLMACLAYLPGPVVAPYAAIDARRTWDLYAAQIPQIRAQGLETVHNLESKLIPMSTEMRRVGMRVDVDKAEAVSREIREVKLPEIQNELKRITGVQVEPWEAETCEAALETIGIKCGRTRDGSPKVDAEFLADVARHNEVGAHILAMRKMSKVQSTFLDGHILRHHEKGRLHAEFNQLRSEREEDGFGTVTGRYSVTNPGLQQIPVRDPFWGPIVRGMFLPEEGQILASLDYSSQEPRMAIHFAYQSCLAYKKGVPGAVHLPGAEEAVATYLANPRTDYHQFVADLCGIPRPRAKTLNLGLCIAAGQLVLTNRGLVPIENVTTEHLLWDGLDWVAHEGLVCRGYEDVVTYDGVTATPDHHVYCEDGRSIPIGELVGATAPPMDTRRLAIGAAGTVPVKFTPTDRARREAGTQRQVCGGSLHSLWQGFVDILRQHTSRVKFGLRVPDARQSAQISKGRPSSSNIRRSIRRCARSLYQSAERFLAQLWRSRDQMPVHAGGIYQLLSGVSSAPNLQRTRHRQGEQRGALREGKPETGYSQRKSEKSQKAWVYDLINAGPRHRFTVSGKIVSNSYGMGGAKLARHLGLPTEWKRIVTSGGRQLWETIPESEVSFNRSLGYSVVEVAGPEAAVIIKKWEQGAPFVRGLAKQCTRIASERGFISTLLRRRCRFTDDGAGSFNFTHKAMNRLCQSSAADQTKSGMLALWEAGIVPCLTVHDELVFSVDSKEEAESLAPYMVNAVHLSVPSVVDVKCGENWGAIPK